MAIKRFALSLACLFFASFSNAEDVVYTIRTFDSGLNSHASPYILKDGAATQAENVRFNEQFGSLAKRPTTNSYGTIGSSSVTSLFRYYKADATKKLIATGSTDIYVGDDSAGTFQTIKDNMTDGKRFQWVTYQDIAIGTNGFDQPVKYDGATDITMDTDGARTFDNLVAELGAPFAELNTGTNLDSQSWYLYKVAFYNGSTYSYSTARSNPIPTGITVYNVALTDIPLGPSGTTTRYIFRTLGNASRAAALADSTYYKVGTISDNTTTTFSDSTTDNDADDDAAPTWATVSAGTNVTPPKGTIATIHRERLWISGNLTFPSEIYWSDVFNPDYFDPANYDRIREDDGDSITGVIEQLGTLRIFKNNTIQSYYTDRDTSEWASSPSFVTGAGAHSPYSIANSPNGIYYLSGEGLYLFTGQSSKLVSDAVTPELLDILNSSAVNTWGIWTNNVYRMAYTSASTGSTINDRVLVYDTLRDAYSIDTKNINCFALFLSGTDDHIVYSGSSDTDGYVLSERRAQPELIKRFSSEINAGTFDDTANYGTEPLPTIELGWDTIINNWTGGDIDSIGGIIDRPDTDGTWTSSVYQINATSYDQLYWNESLNSVGDITFAVRGATTFGGVSVAMYSSEFTDPNGSDLSALTAYPFIQIRSSLSTSDITVTPELYVSGGYLFRLTFSKTGTISETAVLSVWKSGWTDFGAPNNKKLIKRIKVFYTGTEGTLNVAFDNDEHNAGQNFDIDLSQNPLTNAVSLNEDNYLGDTENKVYVYYPTGASATSNGPTGTHFQFTVTENGVTPWAIQKIEVLASTQPYTD
jgi:hypothetical protein